jgi:hypothetical protein
MRILRAVADGSYVVTWQTSDGKEHVGRFEGWRLERCP